MIVPRRNLLLALATLFACSATGGVVAQGTASSSSSAAIVPPSSASSSSSSSSSVAAAPPASSSAAASSAPLSSVSVASSSAAAAPTTASSNFSLPAPSATATWPAGLVLQSSVPYQMADIDWNDLNLPTFDYALSNETLATRQSLCNRQTSFCTTAGCKDTTAKIKENFCNVETLASKCSCSKGGSNLEQANWPVQLADCQNRANACTSACWSPSTNVAARNSCRDACENTFRKSCGTPGMVSANYAVAKEKQSPSYKLIQGGNASGALANVKAMSFVTLGFVLATTTMLLLA